MTPAAPRRNRDEVARLGEEIYARRVQPLLTPEDDGKYVVLDVETEEYEVSLNEWDAIERLTAKRRGSQLWITRIGKPYRMSFRLRYGQ